MMARKYAVRKPGPKRRVDHSVIKNGFREGKSNKEIAAITGYTGNYIAELRWKYSPRVRCWVREKTW